MAGWRTARSLDVLADEIEAHAPGTTVWTIGDQAHADTWSDHNPNPQGVVCAVDVLGNAGLDLDDLANRIVAANPNALKYVIWNRRIWNPAYPGWRQYTGSNPHSTHVHISVGTGPDGRSTGPYDDVTAWNLWEDDMALTDDDIARIWAHGIPDPRTGDDVPAASYLRWVQYRHESEMAAIKAIPTGPVEIDYDLLAKALLRNMAAQPG